MRASLRAGGAKQLEENVAVEGSRLRVLMVPASPADVLDRLRDSWHAFGATRTFGDAELDCSAAEVDIGAGDVGKALSASARALRGIASRRLLRFEAAGVAQQEEEPLSAVLAQALSVPVWSARREVPASQWVGARPMEFGVDGFQVRAGSPAFGKPAPSGLTGAALEFGAPLITLRAALHGVPADALARICDAVGNARGGLLHIGAAAAIGLKSGTALLVLACSDAAKSALHRALELIDIEAQRYGGSLGATALLSSVPLAVLLQTLAARMPLDAKPAQVIETHLLAPSSSRAPQERNP